MRGGENMDAEKIYSLLFNLYAEQEKIEIEYKVNDSFFSTVCLNQKHSCCRGTVSLSSDKVHPSQVQEDRETKTRCAVWGLSLHHSLTYQCQNMKCRCRKPRKNVSELQVLKNAYQIQYLILQVLKVLPFQQVQTALDHESSAVLWVSFRLFYSE